jgi:hypothetical protein
MEAQQEEVNRIKKSQLDMLEKISGYSIEDAKNYLIESLETEVTPRNGHDRQGGRAAVQGRGG